MNVRLRLLETTDLDNLLKIENDERYWHLSGITKPFRKNELSVYLLKAKAPIEAFGQLRFVIEVNNKFAGLVDLYEYDSFQNKAGVGIILFDEFQRKGIAFKALELLKDYCKKELNINELFARIELDNIRSILLFEKCGFKEKEFLKNYIIKNNKQVDCKEYHLKY